MQTYGKSRHPARGIYGVGEIRKFVDRIEMNNVSLKYISKFATPIPVHQPLPRSILSRIDRLETPKLRALLKGSQENQRNFVPITSYDRPIVEEVLRLLQRRETGRGSYDAYTAFAKEGKKLTRLHFLRERKPKVIEAAKYAFMAEHGGRLYCESCGFDFLKAYGKRGYGFIEGHHRLALSQLTREKRTRPEDIALLCSNCHRMIHRKSPWFSVLRLRRLVADNRR